MYHIHLICTISPEECFNSSNKSISNDYYRRTKFSATMTFHFLPVFTLAFVPHLTINLSGITEKHTFHFVQSLLLFAVKAEI